MSDVSGCRKTEDLVDRWAHDAGIVSEDEHVKGHAGLVSSAVARKERNEGTPAHVAAHVAVDGAREVAPEVADHLLFEGAKEFGKKAASRLAVGVIGNIAVTTYDLMMNGWAKPNVKGDDLRQLAQNDAVNVALAGSLKFDAHFAADELARRPGVDKGTSRLVDQLNGKDAELKPILQARADEGFLATERAWNATRSAPPQERGAAMMKWLDDNGFADRRRNDVAFGKGMEYVAWLHGSGAKAGVSFDDEAKKVHERAAPDQVFHCKV